MSLQKESEVLLGADTGVSGGDKTAKVYGFVGADGVVNITRVEYSEPDK